MSELKFKVIKMEQLKWETKKVKVKDLIQLDINPRKISEDKKQKLVESLEKFNLVEIPAVNTDLQIIGGNQRVTALLLVGRGDEEIDVRFPNRKLTKKEVKEYAIISNTHAGEFDFEILDLEFADISIEELGFEIEGWDDWKNKQDTLLAGEAQEDDFDVPVGGSETDIVLGDLFEIGGHRLLCGDSTDSDSVAKLMNGEKADMVFTDPPYGVDYKGGHNEKKRKGIENDALQNDNLTDLFYNSLLNADLFTRDYAAFYIWYSNSKAVETFKSFAKLNLEIRNVLIWYKIKSGFAAFMAQYIQNYEPVIYAFKKGKSPQWFGASTEKTVWELKKDNINEYHPTQKPIELPEKALINSSKIDDIILDLFLGSGSTMVASHQLNRKCYGMELDPKYCQVIIDRMIKLNPSIKITKNGKEWNTTKIS